MDITIRNSLTEKLTVFYEVDSQLGAALCAAGIASPYVKPAPAPPAITETKWFVRRLPQSGKLTITCQRPGGETVSFAGLPSAYKDGLHYCDSSCPETVVEEYARQYGQSEVPGYVG
jgi:hypothetical protein